MWIRDTWRKLTFTEKLLLGMVFMLLIMIAIRWGSISKEVSETFNSFFERHATE